MVVVASYQTRAGAKANKPTNRKGCLILLRSEVDRKIAECVAAKKEVAEMPSRIADLTSLIDTTVADVNKRVNLERKRARLQGSYDALLADQAASIDFTLLTGL